MQCECEKLRERIAELEDLLGMAPPPVYPFRWIGDVPMRLLGLIIRRGAVTREFAFRAIYGGLPESDQPKDDHVIDAHVCRLNKHLRPLGAEIESRYGQYLVGEKTKSIVENLLRR